MKILICWLLITLVIFAIYKINQIINKIEYNATFKNSPPPKNNDSQQYYSKTIITVEKEDDSSKDKKYKKI